MIKNPKTVEAFENNSALKNTGSFKNNLKLMDAMYNHARKLHDFTKDDFSVREIEHVIRYSKVLKNV
jgi:hypothetical protein